MYKDAFELIGKLMQNHLIVQSINFTKKGFKTKWTDGSKTFHEFDELEYFLELYEDQENQLKK